MLLLKDYTYKLFLFFQKESLKYSGRLQIVVCRFSLPFIVHTKQKFPLCFMSGDIRKFYTVILRFLVMDWSCLRAKRSS